MISRPIENSIINYFSKSASKEDLDRLSLWLNASLSNKEEFKKYVKINYLIEFNLQEFETEIETKKVLNSIAEAKKSVKKKTIRLNYKYISIAASIAFLISLTFIFINNRTQVKKPIIVNNDIPIGTDKAILTLEDGSQINLEKGENYISDNLSSNGEEVIYNPSTTSASKTAFNVLTIPRGGEFFIKLSDGTQVWINSESQLKYPVSFKEGETRQVELVYGEAYFEVSPSTNHKGSKFKVINQSQEIEVLGTKFNLKAYKGESTIYTTLVEGKVEVNTPTEKQLLQPNQQSKVTIENSNISIKEVDSKSEIAWIHGDFVFQKTPLKDIIRVLSRWYDIEIEIQNKSLENVKFNGELSKHQNLEDILILIKNTNYIKQYEINDKKIILN